MPINLDRFSIAMHDKLKPREIDIIRLMKYDLTNRQIAQRLGLSVETVRWYAKQIYAKLNVSGRDAAVIYAEQHGLLKNSVSNDDQSDAKHNLPILLTSFVGRETHRTHIVDLLTSQRLITLTGTGGTGKTRLVVQIGRTVLAQFSDGVYFVDLVPVLNPDNIAQAIASVLDIHPNDDEPIIQTLCRVIGDQQMLLLLDNYEHIIAGASVVHTLLANTTNLKIIVTSREVLKITGEQEYHVPPLVILNDKTIDSSEAVTLFTHRAKLVKPSFEVTDNNIDDILLICEQLDGLPLAIELVAAHIKLLSPSALLKRMDKRITGFANRALDIPNRHRTLYQTIDWSYQLLSDEERQLFLCLSIFNDGAPLDAIEAIVDDDLETDLFDLLLVLIDKSMIRQYEDQLEEPRFYMLETLKAFGRNQLNEANRRYDIQQRYVGFYHHLTQQAAPELMASKQEYWFTRLGIEQGNIRQVLTWALDGQFVEPGIQMIAALRNYWWYQGLHGEGWHWFERGEHQLNDVSDATRAEFLLAGAFISYFRQDAETSMRWGRSALALYTALEDDYGIAWCYLLPTLGRVQSLEQTIKNYEESLKLLEQVNDTIGISLKHNSFALLYMDVGMYEKAEEHYLEGYRIAGDGGNARQQNSVLSNLGDLAFRQGRYDVAAQRIAESIRKGRDINFGFELHHLVWTSVWLMVALEEFNTAMVLYGAAQAREQRSGQKVYPNQLQYVREFGAHLDHLRASDVTFEEAYAVGYAMSLDDASDFLLDTLAFREPEQQISQ